MEKLVEEVEQKIKVMNEKTGGQYNLSNEMLESLYSVYPFNKFEYIISHLIGTDTISLQQYED